MPRWHSFIVMHLATRRKRPTTKHVTYVGEWTSTIIDGQHLRAVLYRNVKFYNNFLVVTVLYRSQVITSHYVTHGRSSPQCFCTKTHSWRNIHKRYAVMMVSLSQIVLTKLSGTKHSMTPSRRPTFPNSISFFTLYHSPFLHVADFGTFTFS